MAIRYSQPLPVPVQEFVEPNSSDVFIWWLFRRRCVMCHLSASEINEIQPRGRSNKNLFDWKNRVTLCHSCHEKFHHHGVTTKKIEEMQKEREKFLMEIGRSEYVNVVSKLSDLEWMTESTNAI